MFSFTTNGNNETIDTTINQTIVESFVLHNKKTNGHNVTSTSSLAQNSTTNANNQTATNIKSESTPISSNNLNNNGNSFVLDS